MAPRLPRNRRHTLNTVLRTQFTGMRIHFRRRILQLMEALSLNWPGTRRRLLLEGIGTAAGHSRWPSPPWSKSLVRRQATNCRRQPTRGCTSEVVGITWELRHSWQTSASYGRSTVAKITSGNAAVFNPISRQRCTKLRYGVQVFGFKGWYTSKVYPAIQ